MFHLEVFYTVGYSKGPRCIVNYDVKVKKMKTGIGALITAIMAMVAWVIKKFKK